MTFTNKAALEIKERLERLGWSCSLPSSSAQAPNQIMAATFHALCASILRQHGRHIGIAPFFCIYDSDEQKACIKSALTSLALDPTKFKSSMVLSIFSKARSFAIRSSKGRNLEAGQGGRVGDLHGEDGGSLTAEDFTAVLRDGGSGWRVIPEGFVEGLLGIYNEYCAMLTRARALDFDMLLLKTVSLLQLHPRVLQQLRERWKHVLVDEWQDINLPQYRLVQLLANGFVADIQTHTNSDKHTDTARGADREIATWEGGERRESDVMATDATGSEFKVGLHTGFEREMTMGVDVQVHSGLARSCSSVFVVGDEDQRIYGWRGAVQEVVRSFARDFAACQIFTLEPNFRSSQVIATAAQHVIEGATMERNKKTTRSVRELGEPIRVFAAYDERDEAEFVATQVLALLKEGRISSFADVGVVFRANLQSRVLEESFCRHRIPHRVVGAVRFYERKEVKDVVAYLRLLYNKHDTASMERILNVPPRGIGPQTRHTIQLHAQAHNCSIMDSLHALSASGDAPLGVWDHVVELEKAKIEDVKSLAADEEHPTPHAQSTASIQQNATRKLSPRKRAELAHVHATLQQLQKLVSLSTPAQLMGHVIAQMQLEPYFQSLDHGHDRWANVVELQAAAGRFVHTGKDELGSLLEMAVLVQDRHDGTERGQAMLVTMHASKGLEFKVVMCVGMEEGTFPHHRALLDPSQLHEERRLAFVALTRARDLLYLSSRTTVRSVASWQTPKDDMPTKRSRFLNDIPSELQVEVCATGAPLLPVSLARIAVVLTRAAAESRATALIRSQMGDIVTWQGLRALAAGTSSLYAAGQQTADRDSLSVSLLRGMDSDGKTQVARVRPFDLQAPYSPCGDQPRAISGLVEGIRKQLRYQTLRGATGTGKTFVMANIINDTQRPTLVLAPNKMLAAQLCNELKEFFPHNNIEYFVSYYDYYRPEAYMAVSDVFVEKVSVVNDDIDRLRHAATRSLFERRDTVIVSSVSCIYGSIHTYAHTLTDTHARTHAHAHTYTHARTHTHTLTHSTHPCRYDRCCSVLQCRAVCTCHTNASYFQQTDTKVS